MPDSFLSLSPSIRKEALADAANRMDLFPQILEKDIWVVWALETIFTSSLGNSLTFKGGTSLSKCYRAIKRFSEDIDLSLDIRKILSDKIKDGPPLPPTASQAQKWTEAVNFRLPAWIENEVIPVLEVRLHAQGLDASIAGGDFSKGTLTVNYRSLFEELGYVRPDVRLEFGARSTGEPWETLPVVCDIAHLFPDLVFPQCQARVLVMERTFWEKMTAIHVICQGGKMRSDRFSRHWHDIAALSSLARIQEGLSNTELLKQVVEHKSRFFREKDQSGREISYQECLEGGMRLVPNQEVQQALRVDYDLMTKARYFHGEIVTFDGIIRTCAELETKINRHHAQAIVGQGE